MSRTGFAVSLLGVLISFGLLIAGCGGGAGGVAPVVPNDNSGPSQAVDDPGDRPGGYIQTQDSGSGFVSDPQGVLQYDGRTDPPPPSIVGGGDLPPEAIEEEFGNSIVVLPQNSSGEGTILLEDFKPGQKVVMITTNLDRSYLNFTRGSLQPGLPFTLPDSYYNFTADNLQKVTNSILDNPYSGSGLEKFDVSSDPYYGISFEPGETLEPSVIAQRELEYAIETGYLDEVMEVTRTPSLLSKGIVRTFSQVDVTIQMPPVSDPESEDEGKQYQWPWLYQFQDGRLIGIGAHCYVFLSTEINNGYADGIKFTHERIHNLVKEFDSNIFPVSQAAFGPVRTYNEETIYFPPDRNVTLSPDDFDEDGNLLQPMEFVRDDLIEKDQRIIITILNGVSPGGGGFYISPGMLPDEEPDEDSPYATAPDINYDAFSTVYIDPSNFPANDDDWSGAYSVIAHEFQHKLHSDNAVSNSTWFNEGLSMLNMYICGYNVEEGTMIDFFSGQLESFMANPNINAMFNDVSSDQNQGVLYAPWFLFMLYVMEHYGPGTLREFYTASGNVIEKLENSTDEPARYIFQKWILANYIDSLDVPPRMAGESIEDYVERVPLADPRFRYATFDMTGRLGGTDSVLPGIKVHRFPETEEFYPVISQTRLVKPWCAEYVLFENGTGSDLRILVNADANFRTFILPINYNPYTTTLSVDTSVYIP